MDTSSSSEWIPSSESSEDIATSERSVDSEISSESSAASEAGSESAINSTGSDSIEPSADTSSSTSGDSFAYTIQVDAFIPQPWVFDPLSQLTNAVAEGDDRTTGTESVFKKDGKFTLKQTIQVYCMKSKDPDGKKEEATHKRVVDSTRLYDFDQAVVDVQVDEDGRPISVTGRIKEDAANETTPETNGFIGEMTASADGLTVSVSYSAEHVVVVHFVASATDPFAPDGVSVPVSYDLNVTIDESDPEAPKFAIKGTHTEFPSFEVYINEQRIHHYDAVKEKTTPLDLTHGKTRRIDRSGTIEP